MDKLLGIRDILYSRQFSLIKKEPNSLVIQKDCLPLQPQTKSKGAIAQLVEQRTENPCVPGSIPGGTTCKTPKCFIIKHFGVFRFSHYTQ